MRKYRTIVSMAICAGSILSASALPRLEKLPDGFRDIRDPFLPPDYEQPEEVPDPVEEQREALAARIAWPQLRVRGITHTGRERFIAIIEQIGIVEEGETVSLREGHLIYTWRIDTITAEGITTTRKHVTSMENPDSPVRIMEGAYRHGRGESP